MSDHSVHTTYSDQLGALATDGAVLDAMREPTAADSAGGGWQRVFGRFSPGADPYAILVLERDHPTQSLRTCACFEREPRKSGYEQVASHNVLGWVAWSSFPHDRKMPTLSSAMERAPGAFIVRYRPGKRCTFRVEQGTDTFFGKVFPDNSGARLHQEAEELWRAGTRGELGFAVAGPVRWDPDTRTLWQRSLGGTSIYPALAGPNGPAFARRVGAAAGTLPRSSLRPTECFDAKMQCQRSWNYARELGMRVPGLAARATSLVATLADIHARRPARPRAIHGAPHMNQWLDLSGRLGLVDFDRFSLGDPELDVCTFLGELDFEDGLTHRIEAIADAFISGYEETAGPLDATLLQAYRSHKRLAKALRSARALRADGDRRADRHLRAASEALDERGVA